MKTSYSRVLRVALLGIMAILFILGAIMDPAKLGATLLAIPVAFSSAILWVILTLALVWLVVDLAAKYLLHKSLRQLIEDNESQFEQNLVIALTIVVVLAMLVAK
jgi:Kef-type K+ transport system membrane component KefB